MTTDLKNRTDVNVLVCTFYDKIRHDELLGPIFNKMISEKEWPAHLEKLTDFWETNLFGVARFKGNPTQKHIKTDAYFNYMIDEQHFDRWLTLWKNTIQELFVGDKATRAQMAAYSIAEIQKVVLQRNKPKK